MATNIKAPPSLSKSSSYESWLKEVAIWQAFTSLEDTKQGPAIFLSLEGRAREAVLELEVKDISNKNGVKTILDKLNTLYLKDKTQSAYEAYDKFENFRRPSEMSIDDYINQFERLKSKTESYGTSLSTDVLAYRLLKSANLSQQHEQLAKATISKLEYDIMKTQLKKIFGDVNGANNLGSSCEVKTEPAFHCSSSNSAPNDSFYGKNFKKNSNNYKSQASYSKPSKSQFQKRKPKGRNPVDDKGEVTRCVICDSFNHWASNCPDKVYYNEQVSSDDDEESHQITLFQSNLITNVQMKCFVAETFNTAVLDSGATANVAGKTWVECYINSLSEADKETIVRSSSDSSFKFGSDKVFCSQEKVKIPAKIGSKEIMIETDVIDTHVPLLLSKHAMKKADTKIDFTNDTVTMFGEKQHVHLTKSGHYSVALDNKQNILKDVCKSESKIILSVESVDKSDKKAIATKLHSQFVHPPVEKLIKLISLGGLGDDIALIKALKQVSSECKICKEFRKTPARPIVAMPMARSFNEVVAMDLKNFEGRWILHIIDHLIRLQPACLIEAA